MKNGHFTGKISRPVPVPYNIKMGKTENYGKRWDITGNSQIYFKHSLFPYNKAREKNFRIPIIFHNLFLGSHPVPVDFPYFLSRKCAILWEITGRDSTGSRMATMADY